MGNFGFGDRTEYKAVFSNASMLEKGDDVRVAGVSVGEVKKVEHYERDHGAGDVRGEVRRPADDHLAGPRSASSTWSATATSRSRPATRPGQRCPTGSTKASAAGRPTPRPPAPGSRKATRSRSSQTTPALDLTELFNGFKPLFQALTPKQVNELSMNLIQVLQGEGGTVQELMAKTASLTNSLADRDELIGEVIDNLTVTLTTVDQRHEELTTLVIELKRWMTDLARDRDDDRLLARQHLRPDGRRGRPAAARDGRCSRTT